MALSPADIAELRNHLSEFHWNNAPVGEQPPVWLRPYLEQFPLHGLGLAYRLGYFVPGGRFEAWGLLACHSWQQPNSRGTVCFAPGLFDHAGLFIPLFSQLVALGYDLVCLEMPGHGLSDGQDCAIDSFDTYGALWQAFLNEHGAGLPKPWIGLGQSTGCAALMSGVLVPTSAIALSRLVFLAPLIRPRPWWQITMAYHLLGGVLQKVPRGKAQNSHSEQFNALLAADVLQPKFLSVTWVKALFAWVAGFALRGSSEIPLLVLQGTGDQVVDWPFNLASLAKHFSTLEIHQVPDAKHHLANEASVYQEQVFSVLREYLNAEFVDRR